MPLKANLLFFALKTFLFLLICFAIGRIAEIVILVYFIKEASIMQSIPSLWHALYLDAATACYGVLLLSLLYACYQITQFSVFYRLMNICVAVILTIYSCIVLGESILYTEWKTKLNMQALLHFINPKEVFSTASISQTILFFAGSGLLFFLMWKLWMHLKPELNIFDKKWKTIAFLIPILGACVIGLRGGLQPIPIQISDACFSKEAYINDVTINPIFSLAANYKSYIDFEKTNPYECMPAAQSKQLVNLAFADTTIPPIWLSRQKPNIVMIFLESWSADASGFAGGDGFAKHLDGLAEGGIAFSNCYAAGYASDQGIPAVLSGFPASAKTSIINESSKSIHLPSITLDAKKAGYETAFCFGGQLNYGNIKNYIIQKKVDVIKEQSDIDASKYKVQRLGICDADMATYFIQQISKATPPFFYNWFTLSSHAPYDMPSSIVAKTSIENNYINSVIYSDSALGYFMQEAKKQAWYANTLFVIVADHSHNSHQHSDMHTAARHKIPLVLYGDVIRKDWVGKKIKNVVSQTDIAITLMQAAGIAYQASDYAYSKNLFSANHIAPYCYYDGGGCITDGFTLGYGIGGMANAVYANGLISHQDSMKTKAVLQQVFEQFRNPK
jgi:phosphoglycerol transferase MdoB-like AlkP superfamily enzyme